MNSQEYQYLLSEFGVLMDLLTATPETNVIDRLSLQTRLDSVNQELETAKSFRHGPFRVLLTFRGAPVVGTHGIFAEFGSNAVSRFADTVAAFAASQAGSLGKTGAIPHRHKYQLLVTGTAVGSFGFELEEHMMENQLDLGLPSPVEQGVENARNLMQASVEDDDDGFAEAALEFDLRAVKELHGFIKLLADQRAVCALVYGEKSFQFRNVEEVCRSADRLSLQNLREQEQQFTGRFLGILPEKRDFEFRVIPDNRVLRGKIDTSIENTEDINRHLDGKVNIIVHMTQDGDMRPRYVLLSYVDVSDQ